MPSCSSESDFNCRGCRAGSATQGRTISVRSNKLKTLITHALNRRIPQPIYFFLRLFKAYSLNLQVNRIVIND